jgi:hypothetical protein
MQTKKERHYKYPTVGTEQTQSIETTINQTCQVSRFNRETHDFLCFLTILRLSPQISRFSDL